MKYLNAVFFILVVIFFSGCLEEITGKVDVVFVNVSVVNEDNKTVINNIEAKKGVVPKINAPGFVAPDKFPGIYIKIKQPINISSNPYLLKDVSVPNGLDFKGAGTYTFTVQLFENELNQTQPVTIYTEIIDNKSKRLARTFIDTNLTD